MRMLYPALYLELPSYKNTTHMEFRSLQQGKWISTYYTETSVFCSKLYRNDNRGKTSVTVQGLPSPIPIFGHLSSVAQDDKLKSALGSKLHRVWLPINWQSQAGTCETKA